MTTIAFKDSVLAFDSLVTAGGTASGYMIKGTKTKDYLVAAAGNAEDVATFLHWMKGGAEPELKEELGLNTNVDISALVIDRENTVYQYEGKLMPFVIKAAYHSCGSGAPYALGAMEFGATASEAVTVARKLDAYTGGRIRSLKF